MYRSAQTASNSGVATLRNFAGRRLRNACWGAPQTRWTSGQIVPKSRRYAPIVCGLSLSLLGLIFPPVRHAKQMINVRLDRHSLPHICLGLAVFRIEGFFLSRQFLAGPFSYPPSLAVLHRQKLIHSGPGRPVSGKLRLMLRQIFFYCTGPPCNRQTQAGFWRSPQ